jgi:hypothetical protein
MQEEQRGREQDERQGEAAEHIERPMNTEVQAGQANADDQKYQHNGAKGP